ncbi:CRISPR-associated helicase/endonuclease Cas3 [Erwinia sp. OLTSP20]|uniref:CRISPR-associated helicase/endonuclease Cas3 n=1 Tax=unclassified Erwinia TaxID=2622719 RepID=UPI000C19D482|nr:MULTISPECIES: CRISPR-associated helicase/endonuclease Cas3 [unclassified Erwinia]PIJ49773.1 CRISPR-associated helicase/endonuclease Cas3 [Erwinia sp. OAMSP11]PIJ70872.1 CRISPR-associated helicase/endonuclease Cas3 [Erwinia sp. OLSSP12]PIJ80237.1 CRISPR-associated helicase/endonuclease Cas3 [Erwinia sp. OLCASP19]PIJ82361.1 CRISPR-associated helicase/endonuclease Cas3 [Erwinia sp. OLMTSP26]PIJ85047.1 CRISPR-associated helicase/endonuclease Cas3 [Erwinia sp. OLMDSP33]
MLAVTDGLYRYWGKAATGDNGAAIRCHLLVWHSLDVAAVAACWWDRAPALRQLLCAGNPPAAYRAWLLFFVALHDFGKWDIRFQAKCWPAWRALNPDESSKTPPWNGQWDHGAGGLYWLKEDERTDAGPAQYHDMSDFLLSLPVAHCRQAWFPWMEAVTGHHGYIYSHQQMTAADNLALTSALTRRGADDKQTRQAWLKALEALFLQPAGLSLNDQPPPCSPLLAGFCSIADWLGSWSSEDTFVYQSVRQPLADYFSQRYQNDAPVVLERSGLLSQINVWQGIEALLAPGQSARQLQTLVNRLPERPGLTIIEAPTGSGKTETALAYAWRLLASGSAESIVFALPTQATANAMLDRLDKLATCLFNAPNLILAHGNSRLSRAFLAVKSRAENVQKEDGEAWAQCCEWLSRSQKRAFLGQIGVCTIDQVLISVLPVKHRFIRGFGLGRSVLLVDEVHAYDTYMHKLLEEVLHQQYLAGQSALLLSATLPPGLKQQLLKTYGGSAEIQQHAAYPLVTWQQKNQRIYFDLSATPQQLPPSFSLTIDRRYLPVMQPDEELLAAMIAAARAGAQVCLICNLVDVAQQVYQQLRQSSECNVMLFHSRFTLNDRSEKEASTLAFFGKSGDRCVGRILVATQVVEQSLDVDFDWLITQLCPADFLFQRAGRLHRHHREKRPPGYQQPVLTVLLPDTDDYGNSNYIYSNTRAMWRTQRLLERLNTDALVFPSAYRRWIDEVYHTEPVVDEPGWVTSGMQTFADKEQSRRYNARLMLNSAQNVRPFADDDSHVRAVTRDGEMSLPLLPFINTPDGRRLLDGQIIESLGEYSVAEQLMLNRVNVPYHWQKNGLPEPDEHGVVWIAGRQRDGQWFADLAGGQLDYSPETGMSKTAV